MYYYYNMVKTLKTGSYGLPYYTAAALTVNVKASSGTLIRVSVTSGSPGTLTFYNAIAGTTAGDTIAVMDTTAVGNYELGINCSTGIRLVKSGTAAIVVSYI